MKTLPPLNYAIWVTANNWTWFRVRVAYMSDSATVYNNLCTRAANYKDIAVSYPFSSIFREWKISLDGTERNVAW